MKIILSILFFCSAFIVTAQPEKKYDPHVLFSPLFYPPSVNEYRAANGEPGPKYWQNKANYQVNAVFDDVNNTITASEIITYTNNSPHTLEFLWLQLDQNLYNKNSRGFAKLPANSSSRYGDINSTFNGGYTIKEVKIISAVAGKISEASVNPVITDTRMQIILPKAVAPGGVIKFRIEFSFSVSPTGSDRGGILPSQNGDIYTIAQWYPRMCVFDDIQGWNTMPFLGGGEFYLEYGDFDVIINAPAGHVVVASGDLQNPEEVLSPEQLKRFNEAKQSDKTIIIKSSAEVKSGTPKSSQRFSWHYKINNARDFAWATSRAFIWDGARINLPSGRRAFAMSVYPIETKKENGWPRSTEFVKGMLEIYSKRYTEYPYNSAVNVACNVNGMEYPAIIFCSTRDSGEKLFDVTSHEFGHTWFPMIVGSNERKYGWMDEGFNTFINNVAAEDFNDGEYRKLDPYENAYEKFGNGEEALMTTPDGLKESSIPNILYYKPAYALHLLRNEIIGPQRFDYAFKNYIVKWSYKHPSPFDFFRMIENAAGEDLGWFWRQMFFENWTFDQRVNEPVYISGNPSKGALVVVDNLEKMAFPVYLEYETVSGKKQKIKLPVEVWQNNTSIIIKINSTEKLKKITIDPDRIFPDVDFHNNTWTEE
jgi:hypothetical protein